MTDQPIKLDYFFDPFCGWCYASAPALKALAEAYPEALAMHPSGLFAGDGTRPMASIADFAWRNDTRISQLTGQPFTEAYRDQVLRAPDAIFDSMLATRAIVALGDIDASLEPFVLKALQTARYVDGKDTGTAVVVATVAAEVARSDGHTLDETAFAEQLLHDGDLAARTDARIGETQAHMQKLSLTGVPQLLVTVANHREVIGGGDLYGGGASLHAAIERVAAKAKVHAH
ncbi:DsbA family protein [Fulvimarina sp. MAC8]|uniref:DsbA family protein n=1 Tax=Fulvimarina sp. MAC8 TaxID=3162874 RepID=UPI0032EEA7C6